MSDNLKGGKYMNLRNKSDLEILNNMKYFLVILPCKQQSSIFNFKSVLDVDFLWYFFNM